MNPRPDTSVHPAIEMIEPLLELLGCQLVSPDECEAADVPLRFQGEVVAAVRLPALHGALDRLIETVEREIGCRVLEMNREQKQLAIRLLDDRGAFILRRAVEDVADAMGVSRITVYNYLNAIHR